MTILLTLPDESCLTSPCCEQGGLRPLTRFGSPALRGRRSLHRSGALHIPSMLVGIVVFLALGIAFAFTASMALDRDGPGKFDFTWAAKLKRIADAHPENTPWINTMTHLGSPYFLAALALIGAAWQYWRKRRWLAIAWIVIAAGGGLVNEVVKNLAGRERPSQFFRDPIVAENLSSKAFPSGHTMGATVGFGLLGYAMLLQARTLTQIILPLVDLPIIVFAIGFSRVYLRVHWATDAIGGLLLGAAWLALCLGFLEAWRRGKGIPAIPP